MNQALRKTGFLAVVLLLSFASIGLPQAAPSNAFDIKDPALFPPEFFSNLSEISEGELLLAGLKSLFPELIVTAPPVIELPAAAPPVVREIEPHGVYIRVKDLPSALPVIKEQLARPLVVLDLRFLQADLAPTLTLGSYLTRSSQMTLSRVGDYPVPPEYLEGPSISIDGERLRGPDQTVFILSNLETRGPLESLLAQLKSDDEVISVGVRSPGATATFGPFPGVEGYHKITGEIRPGTRASLIGVGFVPRVVISVSPNVDRLGYQSLRDGVSLDDLIQTRTSRTRFDEARLLREPSDSPFADGERSNADSGANMPLDPILAGALHIVKALEALGKISH